MSRSELVRRIMLILLLLVTILPVAPLRAAESYVGRYSPNTRIELRGADLWFVRPPFESRLIPSGPPDSYVFETGWVAGRGLRFAADDSGTMRALIQGDDGLWREFARRSELYPELGPATIAALEAALERTIAELRVPGAALYVHVPGRGAWAGARGLANIERGIPMVPGDRLRAASVTKTFVAVVALQLIQEGWLLLDHNVAQWLPGLLPGGERVTVRQLLGHTSGLPDYLSDGFVARARRMPARIWQPRELVAEAMRQPPLFVPGAPGRWAYANTNYILLGLIIERVTGNGLDTELRQRIIAPLGLSGTALAPPTADPGDLARGYVNGTDYTALNMSCAWAAGGLISTAEDLGRFARALFGGELLAPDMLALMQAFGNTGGAWGVPDLAYGLGLMQRTLAAPTLPADARLVWGHTGALAGYRSVMWHLPRSGITMIALVNRFEADPNRIVAAALAVLTPPP